MGHRAMVSGTAILAVFSMWVAVGTASARPITSVIGGEPASISTFPFMARITAREGLVVYGCSGTVVSPNMILTAAHCLLNESRTAFLAPSTFEMLTGTSNLAVPGVVSRAERLVIDPNYRSSGPLAAWHDAGLIQLSAPIAAPAVKLATSPIWGPGTLGYEVGWGVTEPEGEAPTEMQVGETVVQSQAYCETEVGAQFHPLAELCSIDYPSYRSATCHGDSGGPMLMVSNHELVEIGITSFGIREGCPTDSPRVDTRADVEAAWVANEIAAHPPKFVTSPPSTAAPTAPKAAAPVTPTTPALPVLTGSAAKHDLFAALSTDRHLASSFRFHHAYRAGCRALRSDFAQCNVQWLAGIFRYWGIVQISEQWEGTTPVWTYHYWIHQTNELCRSRSSRPASCGHQLLHA
ncbi:MAG: trypsin-like serine protease [Actinobacteria bacterium]|nr:trypsin-like serine protease [Actinomycetota bacterium]